MRNARHPITSDLKTKRPSGKARAFAAIILTTKPSITSAYQEGITDASNIPSRCPNQ
jgi:hypothetical protein